MLRLDDPPAFDDIPSILGGAFEHSPKIDLGEASVDHSLEEMLAEGLQFQLRQDTTPAMRDDSGSISVTTPCPSSCACPAR
jgi:hypothetical protein